MNDKPEEKEKKSEESKKLEESKKPDAGNTGFDWVTERSSCSLPKVFKELRIEVEADVKTRNGLRPNNSPYAFSVIENGSEFTVVLQAKEVRRSITFSLAARAILTHDEKGQQTMEITLTFDDQGKCKLHVNQQEREMWQVRRMALEDLLFRGY